MRVISVYISLNVCKLYNGPIRLLVHHDFTVDRTRPSDGTFKHNWTLLRAHVCSKNTPYSTLGLFLQHEGCGSPMRVESDKKRCSRVMHEITDHNPSAHKSCKDFEKH